MAVGGESGGFVLKGATDGLNPDKVYLAEGMQTAAAVWRVTGCMTVCLFDTSGMQNPPIKALQKGGGDIQVVFAGDRDVNRAGQSAALLGAAKVASASPTLKVSVVLPPKVGEDWADTGGVEAAEAIKKEILVTADNRKIFSGVAVKVDGNHFALLDKSKKSKSEIRLFSLNEVDKMPENGKEIMLSRSRDAAGGYNVSVLTQTKDIVFGRAVA
jgi:phage/plasmid primase-like uncharacterized protein